MNGQNKDADFYRTIFFVEEIDLEVVRAAGEIIYGEQEAFYEKFYNWMSDPPVFGEYYTADVLQAIRDSEAIFWDDLLMAALDDDYIERQKFFGEIFGSVGIPFEAYLAFLNYYHLAVREIFIEKELDTKELIYAFQKVTGVAISAVTDGYSVSTQKVLLEQNEVLKTMSTPVTQLWDGILLLPLVGILDSKRTGDIMTTMLNRISTTQSKVFILDISGIAVVDTSVANYLIKMTKATRLMGCICIISGIAGSVAQTIVELGIAVDEIQTTGSMQDAFKTALKITEERI